MAAKKQSAGILLYRNVQAKVEVLLVHPGGPFWVKKDEGAWSIPKGEFTDDENALHCAIREFEEETGQPVSGNFIELRPIKQKSGKTVFAWALKGDFDVSMLSSNSFEMEWPPKSGKIISFPEVDKAEWFDLETAKRKMNEGQIPLIDELCERLGSGLF